jgi:hypothetical protein
VTEHTDRSLEPTAATEPSPPDAAVPADPAPDAPPDAVAVPLPVTGHDTVDEALGRLADLDGLPTAEHAEVYEDVHGRLQRALADLDGR